MPSSRSIPSGAAAIRTAAVAFVALLGFLATGAGTAAQTPGSLVGVVLDEVNGEPLQGATVVLAEPGSAAITNAQGRFSFEGLEGGTITVRIERAGYSTLVEVLEILPGEVSLLQFDLLPLSAVLEGLLVTADSTARARGHTESAVWGGGDDVGTATDLLMQRVPGLSVTRSDGEVGTGARISLRGVSSASLSNDPAIYVDGVRINEGGTSGAIQALDEIPASSVVRIRVLRGPAATMRYPLAAAGVILVETRSGGGGGGEG